MISIQQATLTNASLIAEIGARSFIESHGNSAPAADIEAYVAKTYAVQVVEEELSNAKNIFHIIYYNDKPAGYSKIIFNCAYPLIENKNVTKLERLYLLKEFHDKKLGLQLFSFITDLSKKEKQEGMWLYVWIENERAVAFYKRAGFEIIEHGDFKISETHSNPNYIMYLKY